LLFNTLTYAAFLPIVLLLYFNMKQPGQNRLLLLASYLFYGWWDERFLFLIILSTALDFVCGLLIDRGTLTRKDRLAPSIHLIAGAFLFLVLDWGALHFGGVFPYVSLNPEQLLVQGNLGWPLFLGIVGFVLLANVLIPLAGRLEEDKRRKTIVTVSIFGNLGVLAFFKYFDFFIESAEAVVASMGFQPEPFRLNIILPVGISFYTFQTLSYSIDIYRKKLTPTDRYIDFALFVSYFPQLVAGPIERAQNLIPRLQEKRRVTSEDISGGTYLIMLGLLKKVAIADGIGPTVASVFNASGTPSWAEVVIASALFSVQLYCDFSGYSDIARGTSRLMGIPLMLNFKMPLLSATPAEFFQRWHLSLTTWLRDYVYYSLGRNRRRDFTMLRNLFLTMAIGGLWHGAAWTFVLWGVFEGALIVLDHLFLGRKFAPKRPKQIPGFAYLLRRMPLILTFFYVHLIAAMLFRSGTWDRAGTMLSVYFTDIGNLTYNGLTPTLSAICGFILLMSMEMTEYAKNELEIIRKSPLLIKCCVYAAMIWIIAMGTANETKQFVYFQF
jgi:alginate O-acetyltransferase complex protein AlgI